MEFKNNIFDYATKELSQDAILCYIFKNFYSENIEEQKISENFIKKFIFNKDNVEIKDINNLKDEKNNKIKQNKRYGNIDICLEIELKNNEKYLILIEDKTETFLHPERKIEYDLDGNKLENSKESYGQLEKEIENALNDKTKKDYKIIYIVFKTKENYEMQYFYNFDIYKEKYRNKETRVQIEKRDTKDFLKALGNNTNDVILKMIIEYYNGIIKKTDKNLLNKIDKDSVKKLDERLREITEIEHDNKITFFRPGGPTKLGYRTEINVRKKILNALKGEIKNPEYKELIERSHWALDIEWPDKGEIEVDIKLNICDEKDTNYLSFKKLIRRNKSKYTTKSDNRKKLIEFISNKLVADSDKNYIIPKSLKENSLQVIKYKKECPENLKNEELVNEIAKIVEKVYNDFIKILNEYIKSD